MSESASRRDNTIVAIRRAIACSWRAWHEVPGKASVKEPSRRVRYDRAQLIQNGCTPARITPYPTGRLFWGGVVPGTSCQATITSSLRDISQPPLSQEAIPLLSDDSRDAYEQYFAAAALTAHRPHSPQKCWSVA